MLARVGVLLQILSLVDCAVVGVDVDELAEFRILFEILHEEFDVAIFVFLSAKLNGSGSVWFLSAFLVLLATLFVLL